MSVWAVILAAGRGTRMAASSQGLPKQFLRHLGAPLYWHAVRTFARVPALSGAVLVFPPELFEQAKAEADALAAAETPGIALTLAAGGARRQDSVRLGLARLPRDCTHVLVHDSARPFFSPRLVHGLLAAVREGDVPAAIPALAVTDTVKRVTAGLVVETLPRHELFAVQTPQAFRRAELDAAHAKAEAEGIEATDDAMLAEALGLPVAVVEGEAANVKITRPDDLALLRTDCPREEDAMPLYPVTAFGYDVHRYGPGRPMVLGGVPIPGGPEVVAHSDGDVLLHALTDALLGCLARGDIGALFPDSDQRFDNVSSGVLLAEVLEIVRRDGLIPIHADLTVIAQIPKIGPHREAIRKNVAAMLGLPPDAVSVKATTEEGLGFTGEKKGIKVAAVATCLKRLAATPSNTE